MTRAVLGLGSNIGDRRAHLTGAISGLGAFDGVDVVAVSDVYETEPVGGPEQGAFLNLVVVVDTDLAPHALLARAQDLEVAADRVREVRWGPRTLDVDVLWIDGVRVDDETLTVPHPRMFERRFVCAPLAEVAPDVLPDDWDDGVDGSVERLGPLS